MNLSRLNGKEIIKRSLLFLLMFFVVSFLLEFLYTWIKVGSSELAINNWMKHFTPLRLILWIIFSVLYSIYRLNKESKKVKKVE